jgi:hypothetical protein
MHRPQHPPRPAECRVDLRADLIRDLAALRRAVRERSRASVESLCRALLRRLSDAELPLDDRAEIAAVVELLLDRVKYSLSERLRILLLPLVAAMESQMQLSE